MIIDSRTEGEHAHDRRVAIHVFKCPWDAPYRAEDCPLCAPLPKLIPDSFKLVKEGVAVDNRPVEMRILNDR